MPAKGQKHTDEAKQKLREARRKQGHPSFVRRGITPEMVVDARERGLKWCSGECKDFIPYADFSSNRSIQCRKCTAKAVARVRQSWTPEQRRQMAEGIKEWRDSRPDYEKRFRLLRHYGVTPEWYDQTLEAQGGVCALCGAEQNGGRKFYCVDHHHETGKVRGLLCLKCNTALERLDSIPNWAARALAYLQKYS